VVCGLGDRRLQRDATGLVGHHVIATIADLYDVADMPSELLDHHGHAHIVPAPFGTGPRQRTRASSGLGGGCRGHRFVGFEGPMSSKKSKRQRGGHPAKVAERRERDRQRREGSADPLRRAARTLTGEAATLATALDAELWASALLGTWWPPDPFAEQSADLTIGAPLVEEIARIADGGAVAALRAIGELTETELGPIALRHAEALEALGVSEPAWARAIEEAEILGTAILCEDVFDDGVTVLIEARHADGDPHAIGIYIDHNLGGMAQHILIADSIAAVEASVARNPDDEAAIRIERIAAAEASTRVHDAMELTDMTLDPPVSEDYAPLRAVAMLRADELPGPPLDIGTPEIPDGERERLLDEFLASTEGTMFASDSDEAFIASLAIDYCCDYVDGRPLRWSPVVVELFMTDWLPRKVLADHATFEAVPRALDAWVRYAGRRRGIPDWAIQATATAITDRTDEMLDRLGRPDDRGPSIEFLTAAKDAGIDPTDRDAIATFIAGWNASSDPS
jgi:hypothetical protein